MNYTLTLTLQQIQVIGAGLGELPLKIAAPVMNEVQKQITAADEERKSAGSQEAACGGL